MPDLFHDFTRLGKAWARISCAGEIAFDSWALMCMIRPVSVTAGPAYCGASYQK